MNITTKDDATAENIEAFKVVLSRTSELDNNFTLAKREATVTVFDDDGN